MRPSLSVVSATGRGAAASRRASGDAVTMLTAYIVILFAVPASLILAPLGSAGSPAVLLGAVLFLWWAVFSVQRTEPLDEGGSGTRVAALAFLVVVLASYAHAMAGPIPFDEISVADSNLLKYGSLVGVLLVANDGVMTSDRFQRLISRLVLVGGLVAVLAAVQFVTGEAWVDRIWLPGLTEGTTLWSVTERAGLARPAGTATSPIELGVVLTMLLPLAITLAMQHTSLQWLYRCMTACIALAILLVMSRAALIGTLVALGLLAVGWSIATRLKVGLLTLGLLTLAYLSIPGLLGTVVYMFSGFSADPSVQSRVAGYDVAWDFFSRSPWLGRGMGTFLPRYWIFDNQYLVLLVEAGIVGLLGFLAVVGLTVRAAWRSIREAATRQEQDIARALFSAVVAGAVGFAFFDTFGFPQSAGTFFLILGLAGAYARLLRPRRRRP